MQIELNERELTLLVMALETEKCDRYEKAKSYDDGVNRIVVAEVIDLRNKLRNIK